MMYIGGQELVQTYFEADALNQSTLKNLAEGVDNFLAKKEKQAQSKGNEPHFLIGGAVDTILTSEEGDFEKNYHIATSEVKASDAVIEILLNTFEKATELEGGNVPRTLSFYDSLLLEQSADWNKNYKAETKLKKLHEVGYGYFEDLRKAFGKKVLSQENYNIVQNVVKSLRENVRTAKYFDRHFYSTSTDIDIYYQLPLYFEIDGIKCKCLIDMFIVFKENNIPVSALPVDLKTKSGYTIKFPDSAKKLRYDIQAAWYVDALLNPTVTSPIEAFNELNMEEIELQNFEFVVESTTNYSKPLIFVVDEEDLQIGRHGELNKYDTDIHIKTPGYIDLLNTYKYQVENNFKEDELVTLNNGRLPLRVRRG